MADNCIVCGGHFKPYKSTQIVCWGEACKRKRRAETSLKRWRSDPEKYKATHRANYAGHREERLAYQREYDTKNRGRISARAKERYRRRNEQNT